MKIREEVVNKINESLADYELSNIYHCEQQEKDLIIKKEYTSYDYIFKFKDFTNSLEVNDGLVKYIFTRKKEDIIYDLNHMPNDILANSKIIIDICKKELDKYRIENILLTFKNKYKYIFLYYSDCNTISIKDSKNTLISLIKKNGKWTIDCCNNLLDCEVTEFLNLKEILKELLNELNKKRKKL